MKQIVFIAVLLIFCLAGKAQVNIDSLENILKTKELQQKEKTQLYMDICYYCMTSGNIEKLNHFTEEGIKFMDKTNNPSGKNTLLVYLANYYVYEHDFENAAIYYDKALEVAIKAKDLDSESFVYSEQASLFIYQNQFEKCIEYLLKSLKIAEEQGIKKRIESNLSNLAALYKQMHNYERAVYYLEKAIVLSEKENRYESLIYEYNLMNAIKNAQEQYAEALEYAQKAYNLKSKGNQIEVFLALEGMTVSYMGLNDYKLALKYAEECQQIAEETNNYKLQVGAYIHLAEIYKYQKKFKESEDMANRVLAIDTTDLNVNQDLYYILFYCNAAQNKWERADFYLDKYKNVNKELINNISKENLAEQEVKYETEKKELRIAALEKERTLYLWLGAAAAVILLLTIVLFIVRQKSHRRKLQIIAAQAALDAETAERSRIGRDLHDRLGGILSAAKMNLESLDRIQVVHEMLDRSIVELRRVSHNLMPEALLREGLRTALDDFCRLLPNVQFHFFGEDRRINERLEILAYLCVFELVNNALKHAKAENINVQVVQGNSRISLSVQDDGRGFDPQTAGGGMGLHNLRARVTAYGGIMEITSTEGKGTEATVDINM